MFMMSRKIRMILGLMILLISVSLLIWGLAPARRETRIQTISPSEMQLPTPTSLQFDADSYFSTALTQPELAL